MLKLKKLMDYYLSISQKKDFKVFETFERFQKLFEFFQRSTEILYNLLYLEEYLVFF